MSFADLKRQSPSSFEKLNKELSKLNTPNQDRSEDTRFWKPAVDKAGNGYAVIRFLPAPSGEDLPFIRTWDHGFQGPGGWYIENSLTTLGEKDPVGEYNSKLWNSGHDKDKEQARKQKRRLTYISNIYVVSDPSNPDNEGKVFLYKYGKKIFDKINDLMNPQFPDDKPVNPFDLWAGANFKLKIRQVEGYRNYDKSEFDSVRPLANDDDELEAIYKQEHGLQEFLDKSKFKSYAELETKLNRVLGLTGAATTSAARQPVDDDLPWTHEAAAPALKAADAPSMPSSNVDDDDDDLEFFKRLANED
jgi:hypothetical protein